MVSLQAKKQVITVDKTKKMRMIAAPRYNTAEANDQKRSQIYLHPLGMAGIDGPQ